MTTKTKVTLEEFWVLPEGETAYELVDGRAIPKISPKYFHSSLLPGLELSPQLIFEEAELL